MTAPPAMIHAHDCDCHSREDGTWHIDPLCRPVRLGDVPVDDINGALEARINRCPVCGGLNPGDITHTRCQIAAANAEP